MMEAPPLEYVSVLGTHLYRVDYDEAADWIIRAAMVKKSGYVCAANVHMVMEGQDDPSFQSVVNRARLVVPDGMPLVWAMRLLGCARQTRVYGPFLMRRCLELAESRGVKIGLLGGTKQTLYYLNKNIKNIYPNTLINYSFSYPFGEVSSDALKAILDEISASGTELLFVGLGCPKQEKWMAEVTNVLPMILFGVGAAFDFFAGTRPMAPPVLQRSGLEWAYRLAVEPRRLFLRYAKHNPRFLFYFLKQLYASRLA